MEAHLLNVSASKSNKVELNDVSNTNACSKFLLVE